MDVFTAISQRSSVRAYKDTDVEEDKLRKILEAARGENPDIKVIIITGFAEMETAKEAFKKGVFDFIAKPFKIDELKQVILRAEKEIADLKK